MASWVHEYDENISKLKKQIYEMDLANRLTILDKDEKTIRWLLTVECKDKLDPDDFVGVTGNCLLLGNWKPNDIFVMKRINDLQYTAKVTVPRGFDLQYRYVICQWNPFTDEYNLRYWETHRSPRNIYKRRNNLDRFGWLNEVYKVNRPWVQPKETILHFQIFKAPFLWPKDVKGVVPYVKLVPMSAMLEAGDSTQQDIKRICTHCEVKNLAELKSLRDTNCRQQDEFGIRCGHEDLVLFDLTLRDTSLILYRFNLYAFRTRDPSTKSPCLYGYGYVRPDELLKNDDCINVCILAPTSNKTRCYMKLNYQVIKPYAKFNFTFEKTFRSYWPKKNVVMRIGHMGCGSTYSYKSNIVRENTLFSFKRAAEQGFRMIEFDIMLTKDAIPIISNDYALFVPKKPKVPISQLSLERDVFIFPESHFTMEELYKRMGRNDSDNYVFPLEAFTADELRHCKVVRFSGPKHDNQRYSREQILKEQQPFPTLKEVLRDLDPSLGFNIEVKYPQKDTNNSWAYDAFPPRFERGFYVNKILEVVLQYAGSRRIIFSSFDCNICKLLHYKQNIYPVMLVIAQPNCDPTYKDPRVNANLKTSISVARNLELFGVVLQYHTLELNPDATHGMKHCGLATFIKIAQMDETMKARMTSMSIEGVICTSQETMGNDFLRRKVFKLESEHNRADLAELQEAELKKCIESKKRNITMQEI